MAGNRYEKIIEMIFLSHYKRGMKEFEFERSEIEKVASDLSIDLPKNLGDVLYSFRFRTDLPKAIQKRAPKGLEWYIELAGRGKYRFRVGKKQVFSPSTQLSYTKIPDSTPGVISMYALDDEQALLAKLRYNRLLDIFSGVTCYSLQNHLRS